MKCGIKKVNNRFLLITFILFICGTMQLWGEKYFWRGTNSDWDNINNWFTTAAGNIHPASLPDITSGESELNFEKGSSEVYFPAGEIKVKSITANHYSSGTLHLRGNITTSEKSEIYADVRLDSDVTWTNTFESPDETSLGIRFWKKIDSENGKNCSLTINGSNEKSRVMVNQIGTVNPLKELNINSSMQISTQDSSATSEIITTGNQYYKYGFVAAHSKDTGSVVFKTDDGYSVTTDGKIRSGKTNAEGYKNISVVIKSNFKVNKTLQADINKITVENKFLVEEGCKYTINSIPSNGTFTFNKIGDEGNNNFEIEIKNFRKLELLSSSKLNKFTATGVATATANISADIQLRDDFKITAKTITLGNDCNISSSGNSSAISLDGNVNLNSTSPVSIKAGKEISITGETDGEQNLIVETTTATGGTVNFGGSVGKIEYDVINSVGKPSVDEPSVTIKGNNTCTFGSDVYINGTIHQESAAGKIIFNGNINQLTSGVSKNIFNGDVWFNEPSSESQAENLQSKFISAQEIIFGSSSENEVRLNSTKEGTKQTVTASENNSSITFNSKIKASGNSVHSLSVMCGTGDIVLKSDCGSTSDESGSMLPGDLVFKCRDFTLEENVDVGARSLKVETERKYLQKKNTVLKLTQEFEQSVPKNKTAVAFVTGEMNITRSVTFASETFVYDTLNIYSSNVRIKFNGNVHFASPENSTVSLTTSLKDDDAVLCEGNFVLYSGTLSPAGNISVKGDLILLGHDNSDSYSDADPVSGVADLFSYYNTHRAIKGTHVVPEKFPDGLSYNIPFPKNELSWCGKINGDSLVGKTIKVYGNFYDNGVNLDVPSEWNLKIPVNDNSNSYFAEAYNMMVKNSKVSVNIDVVNSDHAKIAAAENCTDGGGNTNGDGDSKVGWDFEPLGIKEASIVSDDILCIVFNQPVENSNGELEEQFKNIRYDSGTKAFENVYTDPECTVLLKDAVYKNDIDTIYLKAYAGEENRWNTDATGISEGNAQSTDRGRNDVPPKHRKVVPDIEILKASGTLFETLRDDAKNRIANFIGNPSDDSAVNTNGGARYTGTIDRCKPVLVAVYTGQELHTEYNAAEGALSQPEYDSHNFIEFQYSESVEVGDLPSVSAAENFSDVKNKQAQSQFNSAKSHGGAILNREGKLSVTGYADIEKGSVTTGEKVLRNGKNEKSPSNITHSVYRKFSTTAQSSSLDIVQSHRVRISIAGYVKGTLTANGNEYHNWNCYIESAETPSGKVTRADNAYITDSAKDLSGKSICNKLDSTGDTSHLLPEIEVNKNDVVLGTTIENDKTLYGSWDISKPQFALWFSKNSWKDGNKLYKNENKESEFEIIGTSGSSTGSTIDRIEFHAFDNTQNYSESDSYYWISKNGWYAKNNQNEAEEYAYDITGGSRGLDYKGKANRTSGGIRRSSLAGADAAFKYKVTGEEKEKSFSTKDAVQTAKSSLFYYSDDETKATKISSDDNLYFALFTNDDDSSLMLTSTFVIKFDNDACFITDLAGNLISGPESKTLASLDRTEPQFALSVAAVGKDELYIVFSKKLSEEIQSDYKILSNALEFIMMSSASYSDNAEKSDLTFSDKAPVVVYKDKADVTCVKFFLNRNVALDDIKTTWIRVKKPSEQIEDSQTGVKAWISPIRDLKGNSMTCYRCHALSDFAVNAVKPLNAYTLTKNALESDANTKLNTIHSFDGSKNTDNLLPVNSDIYMQLNVEDEKTKALVYFDKSPSFTNSDLYNTLTKTEKRIWLPIALPSFTSKANVPENPSGLAQSSSSKENAAIRYYEMPNTDADGSYGWKSGDDVQFICALTDENGKIITIDNDADSSTENIPLYALRLDDEKDITSFDLWQFSLLSQKKQRGNVTILNNVINPDKGEDTVIQIDAPEGNLVITVMTLDGSVITYLEHGKVAAGNYYYRWNGKNRKGKSVARGLYFIRITGEGIDETRKVMVVK